MWKHISEDGGLERQWLLVKAELISNIYIIQVMPLLLPVHGNGDIHSLQNGKPFHLEMILPQM
jgi:hypothetical protein